MTEYGLYLKSQKKYKEAFEYIKKAAEAKEPRALYFYALACKDSPEFPTLLNRAMNNGSVEARLYYAREIESKDLGHALSIYKDLADDGNTIAQNEFGIHLMRFNRNNDAMMYFQKAIDGGSIKARFNMATIQLRLDPSSEDGIENLKIAADHGIAQAQYNYALFLERNEPENTHEIKKYYKKCSDQHLPNGMCNYASILFKEGKKSEAKKLFYEAARNGHAVAQYRYAKILEGENKIDEAMYYMELSSKKYPKAAYEYGLHLNSMGSREKSSMYLKEAADWGITGSQVIYGQITSDPEESVKYFKMAADKENPDGIYLLGKSLNDTKLIEKAAKMKHPQAMYDLALIRKDHTLMEKAAQEGNPDAIIYIGNELEQENIEKAIQFYRNLPFVPESMYRLSVITNDNELLHKAASMENKNALFYLYNQTEDQKYLKAAAENGHHRAMYLYSQTLPAEQDEYRRQFLVEASKTEPDALFLLGVEDEDDNKIKQSAEQGSLLAIKRKDPDNDRENCKRAADGGLPQAMIDYGLMLEEGYAGIKKYPEALLYYKKAGDSGEIIGKFRYAKLLEKTDKGTAHKLMKELADVENLPEAMYEYGLMMDDNHYMKRAARHSNIPAMIYLGRNMEDNADAIYYLKMAVENGSKVAKKILSSRQKKVTDEKVEIEEKKNELAKLAENGDEDAKIELILLQIQTGDKINGLKELKDLISSGNDLARYETAKLYEEGKYVDKNISKALELYQYSYENCKNYQSLYHYGILIRKDDQQQSDACILKSAKHGNPQANYFLGKINEKNNELEKAKTRFQKAATKGNIKAYFRYANICDALGEYNEAVKYYQLGVDENIPKCMYVLAQLYEKGLGVEQNYEHAILLYSQAASKGLLEAKVNYALLVEKGTSTARNTHLALRIYKDLALKNIPIAMYHYGRCCHHGIGMKPDFEKAKKHYELAISNYCFDAYEDYADLMFINYNDAKTGKDLYEKALQQNEKSSRAKYVLASTILETTNNEKSKNKAMNLLKEACDQEYLPAMLKYGKLIHENEPDNALIIFKQIITIGGIKSIVSEAEYEVGKMYQTGEGGIKKSQKVAMKYFRQASRLGFEKAAALIEGSSVESA
ncbi:hypothetical protein TRFO_23047 [Tritrichomonas foetus]|uniref:Sel1 repeat family protein n=1 Tax=Tritrichomonas foetus TaxID=1144522 RepID=A0A1J4KGJ1_9EUKA|nr:hypothetical protein TRFO_23047 [Tritrichomonas foetus]|eukprot:OHT08445.1 hypothetical protein TRFO_23047 [Tritrichomonas foetus]